MTDYARDPNNLQPTAIIDEAYEWIPPVDRSFVDGFEPPPQRFLLGIDPCSDEAYSWGDVGFMSLLGVQEAENVTVKWRDPVRFSAFPVFNVEPFELELNRVAADIAALLFGDDLRPPLCRQELDPKGTE